MSDDAAPTCQYRFSLQLTAWLAFGWTAVLAFYWLFELGVWVWPVQLASLVTGTSLRIGPYFGQFWLGRLGDAAFVIAWFAAAFGVGAIIVRRMTDKTGLLAGLFSLAIGLWVTAVAVLIVGATSARATGWVLVLLGAWVLPEPRRYICRFQICPLDQWSKVMAGFIGLALLLNVLGALSPPFDYDELVYHLGAPAEYIKAGRIIALPHNFYSDLPQLTEMLYLPALVVASDVAAKLMHWSFGVLTGVAVFAIAARLWSQRVGWTAAAIFYCLPFVQDLSHTARIDLATTFYATLAFGALLLNQRTMAAMMTGCAIATKWPAVATVLIPAVVLVAVQSKSFRSVAVFCLLSSGFVVPWLVKNWLCTGNPVYPLLDRFFHSVHWSVAQTALFSAKHAPRFDAEGLRSFVSLAGHYSFEEPGAVPVLLMTVPLLLLLRDVGAAKRVVALSLVAYIAWYAMTFRPWRFVFPAFPMAAMAGAFALEVLRNRWLRIVVGVVMAFGLIRMTMTDFIDIADYRQLPPTMNLVTYALGQWSREQFVSRMGGGIFESVVWMNHHLPAGAKVAYIGEARAYYSQSPVLWCSAFDQHPFTTTNGVTHVYVNQYELDRLSRNYRYMDRINWPFVQDVLEHHAHVVYKLGPYVVYELQ